MSSDLYSFFYFVIQFNLAFQIFEVFINIAFLSRIILYQKVLVLFFNSKESYNQAGLYSYCCYKVYFNNLKLWVNSNKMTRIIKWISSPINSKTESMHKIVTKHQRKIRKSPNPNFLLPVNLNPSPLNLTLLKTQLSNMQNWLI